MQRQTWDDIVKSYPDEWVAMADYKEKEGFPVEGIVFVHHTDRRLFHETVGKLIPKYDNVAIRYTGQRVKNPEVPFLWQITGTI